MTPPPRPQAIVFDLGNVLLQFDYGVAARNLAAHCNIGVPSLRQLLDQSDLLLQFECGALSAESFFDAVQRRSGFSGDLGRFSEIFGDIFTPDLPMIQLHERFREAGFRTYLFSNTNPLAVAHIRKRYPFFDTFDGQVLSFEHGTLKPDPRLYRIVEAISRCTGPEIFYIDDRIENIDTARSLAWQAFHHQAALETIAFAERTSWLPL